MYRAFLIANLYFLSFIFIGFLYWFGRDFEDAFDFYGLGWRLNAIGQHFIDTLKLRVRQLLEQVDLRYAGLRRGIFIWETTFELGYKFLLYILLSSLNWLLRI